MTQRRKTRGEKGPTFGPWAGGDPSEASFELGGAPSRATSAKRCWSFGSNAATACPVMRLRAPFTAAIVAGLTVPTPALAIRPFVTDDARVVGDHLAQLETWVLLDSSVVEHTALAAVGPTDWLELAAGAVQGGSRSRDGSGYSLTGPIVQAKALLAPAKSNSWPGVAVATGAIAPFGFGVLKPSEWEGFGYVAVTQNIHDEALLVHANLGMVVGDVLSPHPDLGALHSEVKPGLLAGVGAQVKILGGFHGMAEVYYGDAYDAQFDQPAMQVGARHIFNVHVQIDATFGSTLSQRPQLPDGELGFERWGTLGLRLVTPRLW